MKKSLSIVIPSFNVEAFLCDTMESLIKCKKIDALDIIIVDDGSTDRTGIIALDYVNKYPNSIRLISKHNGGHGSTINAGLEIAEGKYLVVIDGDDWVEFDVMDDFVVYLNNIESDIVVTGHYKDFIDEKRVEYYSYKENRGFEANIKYMLEHNLRFPMTDICYKTQLLKNMELTIQENTFYVDEEFCVLPFKYVQSIHFFSQGFYHYRIGNPNQSISLNNTIKRIDHRVRVFNRILSESEDMDKTTDNYTYFKYKLLGLAKAIIEIYYVMFPNRKEGRQLGADFYRGLKSSNSRIARDCKNVELVLRIVNYLHISRSAYTNVRKLFKTIL